MNIAIFDTETTGLLPRLGSPLSAYPYMAEIYAAQIDTETDEIIKQIDTLVNIPIPMPEKLTKHVHGISNEMLAGNPTFVEIWKDIAEIFRGAQVMVAANLMLDMGVLIHELKRIGKEYWFPYAPKGFCTIEKAQQIYGRRLSNSALYKEATRKQLEGAHRAKADAMATYEVYKWLINQGIK